MKKALPFLVFVALLAGAAMFLIQRGVLPASGALKPSALADSDTSLYLELSDLPGSVARWHATALAAIATEPEVQAFLEKPAAKIKQLIAASPIVEPISQLQPVTAFIAVSAIDQQVPTVVVGFRHNADEETIKKALAPARNLVQTQAPEGKADLIEVAGCQVETYQTAQWMLASTNHAGWYLLANDQGALERSILRLRASTNAPDALAKSAKFQTILSKLPNQRETLIYLDGPPVAKRLTELALASGQPLTDKQLEEIRALQGVGVITSFDGADIRDTAFIQMDMASLPEGKLSGNYPLTSASTLFHYVAMLAWPESFQIPNASATAGNPLAPLFDLFEQLEAEGLGASAFAKAFGSTFSLNLDWADDSIQPSLIASLDVSDRPTAEAIIEKITSGALGLPLFTRVPSDDGATLYVLPSLPRIPLQPAIGLNDSRLVLALDISQAREKLAISSNAGQTLAAAPGFRAALNKVSPPTHAMAFLDLKPIFERSYTMLRPSLVLASALLPGVNETVDLSKLPPTEAISNHLSPVIFTQSHQSDGVLYESVGPFTITQGIIVGSAAAGASAVWAQGFFR